MTDLATRRRANARAWTHDNKPAKGHAYAERAYAYDFRRDGMLYLQCYEDNPKKSIAQRLQEACAAYEARMGQAPNLILVNERDVGVTFEGCEVRVEKFVGPNNYQVGKTE